MTDESSNDLPAVPDAVTPGAAGGGPDLSSLLGGMDLSSLVDMAGQLQQQMEDAQATAAQTEVEGTAGGGAVRITANGAGEFLRVTISPEVVDDVEMLQDLVLAALRDTSEQVQSLQSGSMGGLGDALGGLGNLGDLFGG